MKIKTHDFEINAGIIFRQAREYLEEILQERKPLTSTVRIEQMIRLLKYPNAENIEFVLEKLHSAIKSDLWWLSDEEQKNTLKDLLPLIRNGHVRKTF